jgi:cell division septum initiation protein DivIVA
VDDEQAAFLQKQIDELAAGLEESRDMIAALQAQGVLSAEHDAQLHEALMSSRTIGAAVGIIMATRLATQREAFEILRRASQNSNRKLRDLAEEIVSHSGEIPE